MSVKFARVEVGGHTTVRFFHLRKDAINAANVRTLQTEEQHEQVKTEYGHLVMNRVRQTYFDIDGQVPVLATRDLFPRKS